MRQQSIWYGGKNVDCFLQSDGLDYYTSLKIILFTLHTGIEENEGKNSY